MEFSEFVQLVTPISDAYDIKSELAIFLSLQLSSHTKSVRLQSLGDKVFVMKFFENSLHATGLNKMYPIAEEKLIGYSL